MTKPTIVQEVVSGYFGIKLEELRSTDGGKHNGISVARNVARYIERKMYGYTFAKIGKMYGGVDHSTVMRQVKRVQARLDSGDESYSRHVATVRELLFPSTPAARHIASIACPTCGAPVIQELQRQIASLTARLNEAEIKR